jgi:hypothetical protein
MNTSQREQYEGTVHLFIGTGRSLCKITFMPFMFTIDLRIIQRGLDSLSPLSRFLFLPLSRSSLARSFGAASTFVSTMLFILCTVLFRVRRYLYIYYTWETLLNHVFEDLRKTKAPNKIDIKLKFYFPKSSETWIPIDTNVENTSIEINTN